MSGFLTNNAFPFPKIRISDFYTTNTVFLIGAQKPNWKTYRLFEEKFFKINFEEFGDINPDKTKVYAEAIR